MYSMSLPSSGGVTLVEMLNILEGYDIKNMGHNSSKYLHVLTETMRLAYLAQKVIEIRSLINLRLYFQLIREARDIMLHADQNSTPFSRKPAYVII